MSVCVCVLVVEVLESGFLNPAARIVKPTQVR